MTTPPSDAKGSTPEWANYEEEVAEFFRGLGLDARVNAAVEGARAQHDVDVLVEFMSAGIAVTWVVECKAWKRAIPKERVLILEGVVADVGADRGLLVSEVGFQAGAVRAAQLSNISLTSLEDLRANTQVERAQAEVSGMAERIASLAANVSDLWRWSQPSVQAGGIEMKQMVEFAGDVFELNSMILPKMVSNSYPIVLGYRGRTVASDAAELKPLLTDRVLAADAEAEALWIVARAAAKQASVLVDAFAECVHELVAAGLAFDEDLADTSGRTPRFVEAMQRVGAAAEDLSQAVPSEVRADLKVVMRRLTGHTYAITEAIRPDWDAERTHLVDGLEAIRASLVETVARGEHAH